MVGSFQPRTVAVDGVVYRYQLWLPPGYDKASRRAWPVLLFLHGAGEKGTDGQRHTRVGLGPALRRHPERWPLLAVFPQCRDRQAWRGDMLRLALAALDQVIRETGADTTRQYLSGISMGGYGSWRLALEFPDRFAALAPICGGLDGSPAALDRAKALARAAEAQPAVRAEQVGSEPAPDPHDAVARMLAAVPTWLFHGAADDVIPVSESRVMYEAMRRAGAEVHYTEYPGVRHDSWDRAYGEPAFPRWLLAQQR